MLARKLTWLGIPALVAALLAPMCALAVEDTEFRLLALALHQDTGRDIYLGGIHFPQDIPRPDDLVAAAGPKAMEYRIVTRRTSMRSLLGGMMLQSELATGTSPSPETTRFANDIIAAVRGSLYAGDSFRILLTEQDSTLALLNGEVLARIDNGFVADYFMEGWLGEKGARTSFREQINRDTTDADLLARYREQQVSAERLAAVRSWTQQQSSSQMVAVSAVAAETAAEQVPATAAEPASTPTDQQDPMPLPLPEAGTAELALAGAAASTVVLEPKPVGMLQNEVAEPDVMAVAEPEPQPQEAAAAPEQVQVASIAPFAGLENAVQEGASDATDMIQYSQRLAQFNDDLLRRVYGSVRYPKSAVRRGLQGSLEMDLVLDRDGALRDIIVVRSSGYRILDEAARRAAQRAFDGEFLAGIDEVISTEYANQDNELVIPLPITFRLTE